MNATSSFSFNSSTSSVNATTSYAQFIFDDVIASKMTGEGGELPQGARSGRSSRRRRASSGRGVDG